MALVFAEVEPGEEGGVEQRRGHLGDAAAELIADAPTGEPLTIVDVAAAFDAIAEARGIAPKREPLLAILRRADPAAARYIVKIISGEPRIGLREGLLEDGVARAFGQEREAVGRARLFTRATSLGSGGRGPTSDI